MVLRVHRDPQTTTACKNNKNFLQEEWLHFVKTSLKSWKLQISPTKAMASFTCMSL